MFTQANSNIVRNFVCTVGAVAVSTVFLFAAAGPAQAGTSDFAPAGYVQMTDMVRTAGPIAY